jgi:hypothetical protein
MIHGCGGCFERLRAEGLAAVDICLKIEDGNTMRAQFVDAVVNLVEVTTVLALT